MGGGDVMWVGLYFLDCYYLVFYEEGILGPYEYYSRGVFLCATFIVQVYVGSFCLVFVIFAHFVFFKISGLKIFIRGPIA